MNVNRLKYSIGAVAVASVFATGFSLGGHEATLFFGHAQAAVPVTPSGTSSQAVNATLPDMAGIVERNGQAVVNISVAGTHKVKAPAADSQLDSDDPFFELFRRFGMSRQPRETPVRGLGSGFIVSPDGTILTNAHVVEDADEVTVKLTDKREFKAKVLGIDKASDVAVLKIKAENLPVVRVGNAGAIRVGEWVLAIGSPFGFENSATAGIVSAKSRSLPDGGYVPFIQTDVAVNPGNSGGPLFNMAGDVIGVNSQIYSRSGGYQGLSFAIPIDVAMNVEKQLVEHGKVQHGRLGVMIQDVTQPLAESFGLDKPAGALVGSIEKDSPAAKAGLESGDIILGINGREIGSSGDLAAFVANIRPGDKAKLQVWRKGNVRSVEVSVGSSDGQKLATSDSRDSDKSKLGVTVRPLTQEEQSEAGIKGGLVIQEAVGPAARAGIQAGDILLSVNGEPVSKTEQLRSLVAKAGKKRVAVLIERGDTKLFVPVDLG